MESSRKWRRSMAKRYGKEAWKRSEDKKLGRVDKVDGSRVV
jgi:hypothetical protein